MNKFVSLAALLLVLLLTWRRAAAAGVEVNQLYCCQYGNASACSVGGCQRGNVTAFWPTTQCAACDQPAPAALPTGPVTTSCTWCAAANCSEWHARDTAARCVPPAATTNATDGQGVTLRSFRAVVNASASLSPPLLCCWFDEPPSVSNGTGECRAARDDAVRLTAFVEWLDVATLGACPPRPPCADDCSGHGICLATQCACASGYFGATCTTRCDRRSCVMGRCFVDAARPGRVCHCDANVVGDRCSSCAPGFSGPDCSVSSSSASTAASTAAANASSATTGATLNASASPTPTTNLVDNHAHVYDGALDTVSIVALSIGCVVMVGLVFCTFKRCIEWFLEQRQLRNSATYRRLSQFDDDR